METSKRINRMIGQLKGIEKMLKADRECPDILQQVSAVKSALDSLSKEITVNCITHMVPKEEIKNVEKLVERAINL